MAPNLTLYYMHARKEKSHLVVGSMWIVPTDQITINIIDICGQEGKQKPRSFNAGNISKDLMNSTEVYLLVHDMLFHFAAEDASHCIGDGIPKNHNYKDNESGQTSPPKYRHEKCLTA